MFFILLLLTKRLLQLSIALGQAFLSSFSSHPLSSSPSHLRSFPTLPPHSVLFPNQSNEMDLHWGDFIASQERVVITASCGGDDEWNEKQEEEVSRETNQRNPAAWLTLISSSARSIATAFGEKSTLEFCYTVTSHQSVVFSGFQEFVCHVVLTFLLYNGFFPVWLLNSGVKSYI